MARPLRILVKCGWYHVSARKNRCQALFFNDTDRRRFLGMVAELPKRFGLEMHQRVGPLSLARNRSIAPRLRSFLSVS